VRYTSERFRVPARRLLCVLGLAALGVLLSPASAFGIQEYAFESSFGSAGTGDGQFELAEHSGVAVNETSHDIYVADTGSHRVVQFDSSGSFIRAFGAGELTSPLFIAIDNSASASSGAVYVADTANSKVTKFDANGALVTSWGTGGQLAGGGGKEFAEFAGGIMGITVDAFGNLFVLASNTTPGHLFKFSEAGAFISELEPIRRSAPRGLAVDSDGNFFKVNESLTVSKFKADGTEVGRVNKEANTAAAIAVDPSNGDLFIDLGDSINVYAFGPLGEVLPGACFPSNGCAPTSSFGDEDLGLGAGLAVDGSTGVLYVADFGGGEILVFTKVVFPDVVSLPATGATAREATLNGTISADEGPEAACQFEYTTKEAFEAEGFEGALTAQCDPAGPFTGNGVEAVTAEIDELRSGTEYVFRIVGSNENGTSEGDVLSFQTLGPSVGAGSTSNVTATGALISGEINPNGEATSFVVEYVADAQFQINGYDEAESAPTTPREAGSGTAAEKVVQQLLGLTPDTTYHFRLVATNATATGVGPDRTFTTFGEGAPSLPDGRKYEMVSPPQKSGEVIPPDPTNLLSGSCLECLPGMNDQLAPMQSAPDGQSVVYLGTPFFAGLATGPNEYLATREPSGWASESLSSPLFGRNEGQGWKAFSADLSRGVLYQIDPPLTPQAPSRGGRGFANLYMRDGAEGLEPLVSEEPPNRSQGETGENRFRIDFAGANPGATLTPAFGHVIFEANDALTSATANAPPALDPGAGHNYNLYEWVEGELRLVNVLPGNGAVASDVVFGSGRQLNPPLENEATDFDHAISDDGSRIFWSENGSGQVYVRINGEETEEIEDPGRFLTASADGSKVLLSDGCLYDLETKDCENLNEGEEVNGEGEFQGILGAAEDLSQIYFVHTAVLTGGEENDNGEVAETDAFNLYAWSDGTTSFIAKLVAQDNEVTFVRPIAGDWNPSRGSRAAQVSPDGRFLAFMSRAPLTDYDSRVNSGKCRHSESSACYEVFEYDAAADSLSCASCNPSGERPRGGANLSLIWRGLSTKAGFPQPRNLTQQGRLFFDSRDDLSPHDTNGAIQDVYQWEPEGVGSCERAGGCVSLISSGKSPVDSIFVNATPSGDDAYFITRERLLPTDTDDWLDLYDARVRGGFGESTPIAPCVGEACKGPLAIPPRQPSAGSGDFQGPGNEKQKHKKKKKKHKKKHKHRKGSKHNRGGSR
jgi:DNA-binding beta-propeller fold protein YncE